MRAAEQHGEVFQVKCVPPQMLDSALHHLSPSADGAAKASLDKHGLQPRCDDDDDDRENVCDHHEEDIAILICCNTATGQTWLAAGPGGDDNVTMIMKMFLWR